MVIFDLSCLNGHDFEGWFDCLSDLEDQLAAKSLTCPVCGLDTVFRKPSTFGLIKNRSAKEAKVPNKEPSQKVLNANENDKLAAAVSQIAALTKVLESQFDDVGSNFSAEALKMHFGTIPKRNIRGLSSTAEETMLKKEGVEFFKLPVLVKKNLV
ncbi:MAG: DUF1178 family protein [Deltaproteobacteria bacterium]|jgi:hypothetical protein|nr:DUF1178 family protein [Deltaproteobacteria bacterium]